MLYEYYSIELESIKLIIANNVYYVSSFCIYCVPVSKKEKWSFFFTTSKCMTKLRLSTKTSFVRNTNVVALTVQEVFKSKLILLRLVFYSLYLQYTRHLDFITRYKTSFHFTYSFEQLAIDEHSNNIFYYFP